MATIDLNLFESEKVLIQEVKHLIESGKYDEEQLLSKLSNMTEQFNKLIKDAEKIIKISDGQQEYLHKIQEDLKKEIEERIRAEEKLRYFAAIDTLTGFYNRGMGLNLIDHEIKSIKRNNSFFSICYIDVNGLKYVNDNFGHFEGDELLVLICKFIKQVVRENDILCRLGGDEFVILFKNCRKQEAEEMIKHILLNIEEENKKKVKPYAISFSHGIVEVNHETCCNIDEIIQKADEKMYRCKEKYKNEASQA